MMCIKSCVYVMYQLCMCYMFSMCTEYDKCVYVIYQVCIYNMLGMKYVRNICNEPGICA